MVNHTHTSDMAWNHYMGSRAAYGELSERDEAALYAQCIQLQFMSTTPGLVFPHPSQMLVNIADNGRYTVYGYVDTPNPYGAMVRINYTHVVTRDLSGRWHYTPNKEAQEELTQIAGAVAVSVAIPVIIWIILVIIIFVAFFALLPAFLI